LPPDAKLYGIGWYSMPAIALYSGRRLDDLNDHPTIELEARSPVYLLLDSGARKVGIDAYWLDRYEHTEVAAVEDFSIVALHTDRRRDPFAGIAVEPARLRDYVDFHGPDYPYLFGFYGREGDGWRWARTDVEVLLKYGGERALKIDAFVPEPGAYHRHRNVAVTAWIGACKLDSATLSGRSEVRFDLKGCAPPVGSSARVRLLSDDVVDAIDDRQLALIVNGVGFVDGAAAGTDATP
jgi:hypothetical protein